MGERDLQEPIERLRGLGERIDRAIAEARLKRVQFDDRQLTDQLRAMRRLLREQSRRPHHR